MNPEVLEAIRTRRVHRHYKNKSVPDKHLWTVLEAARWAPSASNQRLHRYMCVTDRDLIRQIRLLSPGIAGTSPAAIIVICVDRTLPSFDSIEPSYYEYIDAGTAAENMLLAAHALDLAACPAVLDSPEAIQVILNMPKGLSPEMYVLVGYAAEPPPHVTHRPKKHLRVEDLVQWGPYPAEDVCQQG
jgi:nitroreductase